MATCRHTAATAITTSEPFPCKLIENSGDNHRKITAIVGSESGYNRGGGWATPSEACYDMRGG